MNTDEFCQIIRTRLFESLPDDADVEAVAQGYAKAVREAKQMDVTNASPEQFARRVRRVVSVPSRHSGPLRPVPGEPGFSSRRAA